MSVNATKGQLIQFISTNFKTPEGERPSKTQLESFKKDELMQVITDAGVESKLQSFINLL